MRRAIDAFNLRDAEAVVALWTTDALWRPAFTGGGLVENAVYRGHDGLREYMALQDETWERVAARVSMERDVGDRVLVKIDLDAVGRASGIALHRNTWNIFEMRDGKVAVGRVYTTEQDALVALGLPE